MVIEYNAILIFLTAFIVSGTAGVAAFLRSGKEPTKLSIITASLNSGLLGLSIALLWYQKLNIYTLIGVCVISGLTGAAGFDAILASIQKEVFKTYITSKDKDEKKNEDNK
jgi:CHASE2 domain-containing sensor protein